MIRRLRRIVTGTGRRVRAPRLSVLALGAATAALVVGAGMAWREATGAPPAARTLIMARHAAGTPLTLRMALDVEWEDALRAAASAPADWTALIAPVLPPPICPADAGPLTIGPEQGDAIERAVLDGEAALRRGDRGQARRAIEALAAEVGREPASAADFVARYGLARLHAALDDPGSALRLIEPVFEGFAGVRFAPRGDAAILLASGSVDEESALLAAHARALAGYAALGRGDQSDAVLHYRLGINHSRYTSAAVLGPELSRMAPARSVPLPLGASACGDTDAEPLTTVDLRAGLIAAYAADESFRDPPRLAAEVARGPAALDANDPLAPVLRHAQEAVRRGRRPAVPENVVWAASNLQEVYRDNRIDPDGRLELTRSVLALRLASTPDWLDAVGQDRDGCGVLGPLSADLARQWRTTPVAGNGRSPVDSARAAVAVRAFAAQRARCTEPAPDVEGTVRGLWLRLSQGRVPGSLAGLYESRRAALESALTAEAPAQEDVEAALGDAVAELAVLRRGRIPAHLSAQLDAATARDFVERWWRTIFGDAARTLAATGRGAGTLKAAEAPRFLEALNATVVQAGVPPSAVFAVDEFAPLAASAGSGAELLYRLRYFTLEDRGNALLALVVALLAIAAVLLVVHVNVWRFRLLTRSRLYASERRASRPRRQEAAT